MKVMYALLALLICAPSAFSQDLKIVVSWQPNVEEDLAGYRVYVGEASRTYGGTSPDLAKDATQFTWLNLDSKKTYYFAVTAFDLSGNESNFSVEGVYTPPTQEEEPPPEEPRDQTAPAAPRNVRVIIN